MATTIKTVGVAGSGTMGAGIAIVAARAGFRTIVYDTNPEALTRARKQTEGFFAKSIERGKLKPIIDRVLPLSEVREAHRIVEEGKHFGKIVLTPYKVDSTIIMPTIVEARIF